MFIKKKGNFKNTKPLFFTMLKLLKRLFSGKKEYINYNEFEKLQEHKNFFKRKTYRK
jgi:hypothetical protein